MRRVLTILVTVTTIMTLTAGAASAGRGDNGPSDRSRAAKVPVCHYDADTDAFHLININSNALASHLTHDDALPSTGDLGEECRVSTAAELATPIAQGNFLDGGLAMEITVYGSSDGSFSGSGSYSFTTSRTTVAMDVTDTCLSSTDGFVVVYGPGTKTVTSSWGAVTTTAGYAVWTLVDEGTSMSMRTKFRSQTLSDPDFVKQCDTPTVISTDGTGSLMFW